MTNHDLAGTLILFKLLIGIFKMNHDSKKEELIHLLQLEQKNNPSINTKKSPLLVQAILESVSAGCGPFASFPQTTFLKTCKPFDL